ncbi:unnamed protein product [marine sediment metagenome]|uniref:Uncharacterized protein n=1 Tax=marine sediment metagenome TaxID=412755 RepID=X0ZEW3_9ZZZZ
MSTSQKYDIVGSSSIELLVEHVQSKISEGWQPLGAPFYLNGSMYQAMVWTESPAERLPSDSFKPAQMDIELIEELTEDDEPLPRLSERFGQAQSGGLHG